MLAPTCSTMISSDEPRYRGFKQPRIQFPLSIGTLLARDSIVGIPIPCSISLLASLFTRSVIHHPMIIFLIRLSTLWLCRSEWVQRYFSVTRSVKSQSRNTPTQQVPSETPVENLYNHPVTLWCLVAHKVFLGIRELHNLIVRGTCISHDESNSNKTKWSLMLS